MNNELRKLLERNGFQRETFDSRNAWGFGGAVGERWRDRTPNTLVVTIATAGTRHRGTFPFVRARIGNRDLFDVSKLERRHIEVIERYLKGEEV